MSVRQFKLINGYGQEFDITSTDYLFSSPSGLGYDRTESYRQIGNSFVRVNKQLKQGSITGKLIFTPPNAYAKYYDFIQFINIEPLKLKILNEYVEDRTGKINLTIAISLVQEQKFDLILQKLTELGVSKIIPVTTDRSIVRLSEEKLLKKYPRWQTILKEASEQSHRIDIPQIEKVMSLKELANVESELKLICSLSDNNRPLEEYLLKDLSDILFVIGPEGGFSQKEEEYLLNNNFLPTTLGKRVLRVETAAIYVSSIINYVYKG